MNYKLTIYPDTDSHINSKKSFCYETEGEMNAARNTCADLLLFMQDEVGIMPDLSNMFLCEEFYDDEWIELDCVGEDD